jgi:hypothetical protein
VTFRSKDQDLIDELVARMGIPDAPRAQANGHIHPAKAPENSPGPSDEQVIERCRAAENSAKFSDLYDHGNVRAHHGGDNSVADLALLGIMAFYTQDEAQLERLFSSSALGQREKWRQRDDYRRRTISRALNSLGESYDWRRTNGGTAARPLMRLAALRHRPIRGSAASATPDTSTVAGFFAHPPEWLDRQLGVYREDPDRHLRPLCAAVAAEVLGDGLRGDEVREEVEKALETVEDHDLGEGYKL